MTKSGGVYVLFLFVFLAVVAREFAVRLRLADPTINEVVLFLLICAREHNRKTEETVLIEGEE